MARLKLACSTAEIALVAATAKTLLQLIAATNTRVAVTRWGIYFDGISVTAEPVQVRVLRQTTAIGGTPAANNPVKRVNSDTETVQTTATIYGGTPTEPTAGDVYDVVEVHPQGGYEVVFPYGDEIIIKGGDRLGFEATAPAGVNARVKVWLEE